MDIDSCIAQMTENERKIRALAENVSEDQARWKPKPDSWSILEVINHLYDEEREDFRVFLDIALHRSDQPRPKIAPQAWVTERGYNTRDLADSLHKFGVEREKSIDWLRGLANPDWDASYPAPWGRIRAGDIFASWVAHDILHMRQLVRIIWDYTAYCLNPYDTQYAGEW